MNFSWNEDINVSRLDFRLINFIKKFFPSQVLYRVSFRVIYQSFSNIGSELEI